MPLLTRPVISVGRLSESAPPRIVVDDELALRPWEDSDAAAVAAVYRDGEIQRWHARTLTSEREALDLVRRWRRAWDDETGASWAVIGHHGGVLGRIALGSIDLHEAVAGVGYWTVPAARRRGIAPRALRAASRWATEVIGFHRLELEHSTQNVASCKVACRAGFGHEGVRRSAALHHDGWHDMHVHALIAEDEAIAR